MVGSLIWSLLVKGQAIEHSFSIRPYTEQMIGILIIDEKYVVVKFNTTTGGIVAHLGVVDEAIKLYSIDQDHSSVFIGGHEQSK